LSCPPTSYIVNETLDQIIVKATYPDIKLDILIRYGLDVEADSRDGSDGLIEFELVQYRYWSAGIGRDEIRVSCGRSDGTSIEPKKQGLKRCAKWGRSMREAVEGEARGTSSNPFHQ